MRWQLIVPVIVWLIHICIVLPIGSSFSGDAKFIFFTRFFILGGTVMVLNLAYECVAKARSYRFPSTAVVAANLTFLYYFKVLLFGPTVGDL